MMCEHCHKNVADIAYSYNYNGQKGSLNLCSNCFADMKTKGEIKDFWPNDDFFNSAWMTDNLSKPITPFFRPDNAVCNGCGLDYPTLMQNGRVGCAECYDVFADQLRSEILPRLQRGLHYCGRPYNRPLDPADLTLNQAAVGHGMRRAASTRKAAEKSKLGKKQADETVTADGGDMVKECADPIKNAKIKELRAAMHDCAAKEDYQGAIEYRNKIKALEEEE